MDLLVIGWDAATSHHLERFDLPYWDSMQHNGVLTADEPFASAGYVSSANAWTTITTGASFTDHHILGFVYDRVDPDHPLYPTIEWLASNRYLPRIVRRVMISEVMGRLLSDEGRVTYDENHISANDVQFKRIWDYLNMSAVVFGCPLTYPAYKMNGVLLSGIPTPHPEKAEAPMVYPPELHDTILGDEFLPYRNRAEVEGLEPSNREYIESYMEQTQRMVNRFRTTVSAYEEEVGFGFLMLRLLDDTLHRTEDTDIIESSYELLDSLTADLVDQLDPNDVLLLSDHGMRPVSRLRSGSTHVQDHDATTGIWGSTHDFDLQKHSDVTPAILDYYGVDATVPQERSHAREIMSGEDDQGLHEMLEHLGYA